MLHARMRLPRKPGAAKFSQTLSTRQEKQKSLDQETPQKSGWIDGWWLIVCGPDWRVCRERFWWAGTASGRGVVEKQKKKKEHDQGSFSTFPKPGLDGLSVASLLARPVFGARNSLVLLPICPLATCKVGWKDVLRRGTPLPSSPPLRSETDVNRCCTDFLSWPGLAWGWQMSLPRSCLARPSLPHFQCSNPISVGSGSFLLTQCNMSRYDDDHGCCQ